MQYGADGYGNSSRYIVFLNTQYMTYDTGQCRYAEQQNTKTPIPTPIKKITGAHEENNPLFFQPEYIPVQKKNEEKKERKLECREQHRSRIYGSVAGLFAIFR